MESIYLDKKVLIHLVVVFIVATIYPTRLAKMCRQSSSGQLLRKGLDTVESLSVEGKGSKTLGKIFLVCTVEFTKTRAFA